MFIFIKLKSWRYVPKCHQGRLISHEKRVDYGQLRHIQDKPLSHHTGHSELTKTFDGMGPHSGDTVSDPSNRGMGLKIHGQLMLACVQPGRPSPLRKKSPRFFLGRCCLYTCYLDASQFSFRSEPFSFPTSLPQTAFKDNIIVF